MCTATAHANAYCLTMNGSTFSCSVSNFLHSSESLRMFSALQGGTKVEQQGTTSR